MRYRRLLLKISGEALAGRQGIGIDPDAVSDVARTIDGVLDAGVEIAVVLGGGNLWRGAEARGIDRASADHIGMLGTVMNALALQNALEQCGRTVRVHTAIEMRALAEPYIRRRAIHQLEKGHVVVLAAGTGNPFFTTDTAASLRAVEIGAEVIMKATKVDGVYTADPATNPDAQLLKRISFKEVLTRGLKVMDATAISLCMDNDLPILVFRLEEGNNMRRVLLGENIGTLVGSTE